MKAYHVEGVGKVGVHGAACHQRIGLGGLGRVVDRFLVLVQELDPPLAACLPDFADELFTLFPEAETRAPAWPTPVRAIAELVDFEAIGIEPIRADQLGDPAGDGFEVNRVARVGGPLAAITEDGELFGEPIPESRAEPEEHLAPCLVLATDKVP